MISSKKLRNIVPREKENKGWIYRFDLDFWKPMALYRCVSTATSALSQVFLKQKGHEFESYSLLFPIKTVLKCQKLMTRVSFERKKSKEERKW